MTTHPGTLHDPIDPAPFPVWSGRSVNAIDGPPQWLLASPGAETFLLGLGEFPVGEFTRVARTAAHVTAHQGTEHLYPGNTFFETIIVMPRRINLGLILSTQIINMHVYNAWRYEPRVFEAFINNAGSGIEITNLPTFPFTIQEQDGLPLTLNVSANGPPVIDGTLDFSFDVYDVEVGITGQRVVVFPFEPIAPMEERLQFKTDVIKKKNGKEQRISLRAAPRQIFDMQLELEGNERRLYESIIFDSYGRPLGVPVWYEPMILGVAITIGTQTITVSSTAFTDLRVGGLAIVYVDEENFEALQVESFTATTITFTSVFTKAFARNVRVLPVRIAFATSSIQGEKMPLNLQRDRLILTVFDNYVSIASATAFGTFDGKVFLDEPNAISSSLPQSWEREVAFFDGETGTFQVTSDWPNARRAHRKAFVSRTRQRLWEVRQLLHHLRGRQISFWIPTFFNEMVLTQNISSGSPLVTIENIGYTRFVKSRPARAAIQVIKNDGTKFTRLIASSAETDANVEVITVTSNFPSTIAMADVARIEYLEKVRMDSDEVSLRHLDGLGTAEISVPVIGVYE